MSAYLIEVYDSKQGVLYPRIIGPFDGAETAEAFAEEYCLGLQSQDGDGGYSAYHVVCDETCDMTPEKFAADYEQDYM